MIVAIGETRYNVDEQAMESMIAEACYEALSQQNGGSKMLIKVALPLLISETLEVLRAHGRTVPEDVPGEPKRYAAALMAATVAMFLDREWTFIDEDRDGEPWITAIEAG